MKIPVYRSRAVATSEAPGRSIRSRMRGDVLAQAELQKASVGQELVAQVGEYAKMRYQAAEEVKLNEALLSAEEGIRTASRDLSRSSRLYDIFEGENLWDQTTTELREQALDALGGNRFTRQKFIDRFGQMELSSRFQLRGVVDRKIEAAAQAAMARRIEADVTELSNPGYSDPAAMIELYNSKLAGVAVDQNRAVKSGRANADIVRASNLKLKANIATNVVNAYVGSDPILAANLLGALEVQDMIDAGEEITEADLPDLPGGSYALYTLQNIPRDDAIEILSKSLTTANKFAALQDKQNKRIEDREKQIIANAQNRYFYYDPDQEYGLSDLDQFVPGALAYLPEIPESGVVSGEVMRAAIESYLDASNAITPEMRKKFDDADQEVTAPYREKSVPLEYDKLFGLKTSGDLTQQDVIDARSSLSREDYVFFINSVETEEEEAVTSAKRYAQATFQYDQQTALDPDLGKASKAAYYAVVADLEQEVARRRLSDEGPMTPREINQFTRNLINDQKEFFDQQLRQDYIGTIDRYNQLYSGVGLDLGLIDPIADLDAWYAGLEDQAAQQTNYARIKSTLKREYFDKGFQY